MKPGIPDSIDCHGRRPIHPETHQPLPLRKQPGYYPGFSTLSQQAFWDQATRTKVLKRVQETPPIRFFDPREANLMELLAAHILPQDDREPSRRIPMCHASTSGCTRDRSRAIDLLPCLLTAMLIGSVFKPLIR
jgi:hypothetical protein